VVADFKGCGSMHYRGSLRGRCQSCPAKATSRWSATLPIRVLLSGNTHFALMLNFSA
jgi:hypothetical protein